MKLKTYPTNLRKQSRTGSHSGCIAVPKAEVERSKQEVELFKGFQYFNREACVRGFSSSADKRR